jgi:hypothetical protein
MSLELTTVIPWNNEISEKSINSIYKSLNEQPIRLLTFQSFPVVRCIYENKIYNADINKSREQRDYSQDIVQLNGQIPIWCFSPLALHNNHNLKFIQDDFVDGALFDRFRCEMSICDHESMNKFYLLEIVIPACLIKYGLTHNSFIGASVISQIEHSQVIGLYQLHYENEDDLNWFYPRVNVVSIEQDDALFTSSFYCHKIDKFSSHTNIFLK